jgi:phosphoribosylanthranilate isomerase
VGVFVNEEQDTVLRIVDKWKLDMVQLHGDESPRYCEHISNHVNTVKAFRIGENENVPYKTFPYNEVVDLYLFDTMGKQYGGTGEQFNWDLLCHAPLPKPYFLSGGIGPEDVDKLSQFCENEKNFLPLISTANLNNRLASRI